MEMRGLQSGLAVLVFLSIVITSGQATFAATEDIGNGFLYHGVATPVSNSRGTVATVDAKGRNTVLVWLFDHSGGYAILMIDAETGKSAQIPMPFTTGGHCPYASILSSRNKFYTHFNNYFVEFDTDKSEFTFCRKTEPIGPMADLSMAMTEDDDGVIWSATYPYCGVVSFNPKTREFKDYGRIHKEKWYQYPRFIIVDDSGWVYVGIGSTLSQIIAFDPKTGKSTPMLTDSERREGRIANVFRGINGKAYGIASKEALESWYEFHKGQAKKVGKLEQRDFKPYIAFHQGLFHRKFPDGKKLSVCDLVNRTLVVEDPKSGETKTVKFDYTSDGSNIMGGGDGT